MDKIMIDWVTEMTIRRIKRLPQKEITLEFLENLGNKPPNEFLKTKNYSAYLEILCFEYFEEKNMEKERISEELLIKIITRLKNKIKNDRRN